MTIPTLEDVRRAAERVAPHVRRTPVMPMNGLHETLPGGASLALKLESLQVTGSFKVRGALNRALTLCPEARGRGLVTASGGNHGLGVAYAGHVLGVRATVYLPDNAPLDKEVALQRWGATVVRHGEVWDDADRAAREAAKRTGFAHIHSFAEPEVVAGQGTLALEFLADVSDLEVLVVPIGGGGLISGVAVTAKALAPDIRVIGVEPVGAPTLYESVRQQALVELPAITTAANTLAPRRSEPLNFSIIERFVDEIVLVTDDEMAEAARWLWREAKVAAELSGAAATAAVLQRRHPSFEGARIGGVVCGAGTAGIT